MDILEARRLLSEHGQQQLLDYYEELSEREQASLLRQISEVNFSAFHGLKAGGARKLGELSPVPAVTVSEIEAHRDEYRALGLSALRAGKVAAVLLAGGQGTRLGSAGPKGAFDIGITRKLSIFGQQFANIADVTREAGVYFHVFVMTSELNDAATRKRYISSCRTWLPRATCTARYCSLKRVR